MESSRLQAEARRGVELALRDGRSLDATVLVDEDTGVVVLRDVTRYVNQIDELGRWRSAIRSRACSTAARSSNGARRT